MNKNGIFGDKLKNRTSGKKLKTIEILIKN